VILHELAEEFAGGPAESLRAGPGAPDGQGRVEGFGEVLVFAGDGDDADVLWDGEAGAADGSVGVGGNDGVEGDDGGGRFWEGEELSHGVEAAAVGEFGFEAEPLFVGFDSGFVQEFTEAFDLLIDGPVSRRTDVSDTSVAQVDQVLGDLSRGEAVVQDNDGAVEVVEGLAELDDGQVDFEERLVDLVGIGFVRERFDDGAGGFSVEDAFDGFACVPRVVADVFDGDAGTGGDGGLFEAGEGEVAVIVAVATEDGPVEGGNGFGCGVLVEDEGAAARGAADFAFVLEFEHGLADGAAADAVDFHQKVFGGQGFVGGELSPFDPRQYPVLDLLILGRRSIMMFRLVFRPRLTHAPLARIYNI